MNQPQSEKCAKFNNLLTLLKGVSTDTQEKLEAKLRDWVRRRQTRIGTQDLRGSA